MSRCIAGYGSFYSEAGTIFVPFHPVASFLSDSAHVATWCGVDNLTADNVTAAIFLLYGKLTTANFDSHGLVDADCCVVASRKTETKVSSR
jgi:hypothetical protein